MEARETPSGKDSFYAAYLLDMRDVVKQYLYLYIIREKKKLTYTVIYCTGVGHAFYFGVVW